MVDLLVVEDIRRKYRFRADNGLYGRYNMDASSRLAFGLCKKYGIDLPKGAKPYDAWKALKEKTGKSAADFYAESENEGADKVRFNTANPKSFTKALGKAKASCPPDKAWRVSGMSRDELRDWHGDAKLHVTDGGSTIAVDNGDIVAVCKNKGDELSGRQLLAFAVKNGGDKLDSYDGNHEFYVKCGFEPVSWCKWDDEYSDSAKEQGWRPDRDRKEDIVFYKYVGAGNVKNTDLQAFKNKVGPAADYDAAYEDRDKSMRG